MDIGRKSAKETNQFIIESEELFDTKFSGVGNELFNHMMKYRNNIAQYDLKSNTEEKYGLLLQKSVRTAITLKSEVIQEDPIIAICSSNHLDTCIPVIASQFLGYKLLAYDCLLPEADLSILLRQIPPAVIFLEEQYVEKMETAIKMSGVKTELVVFGKSDKYQVFDQYCLERKDNCFQPVKFESGEETTLIMFSSGTTGLPKGICLSHNSLIKQAHYFNSLQKLTDKSVFLHFAPYNWITANIILIACTLSGASRVLCDLSSTWEAIPKYKVTHICTSPYISSVLMDQNEFDPVNNRSVKSFITAGSKVPPELYSKLCSSFPEALVIESYGQTEAAGWISMLQWHKEEEIKLTKQNPGTVGRLVPGYRCKIVDQNNGAILGPNQVGEIHLKSKTFRMTGYYKADASNTFDSEGWLKTGDLGYYDENHCLFIVGRCKEMLTYRDFHINPQKLERILEAHPAVENAVVVGISHPIDEYHLKGLVVLKKEQENVAAEEIRRFVDDQVEERMKLRAGVQVVPTIPMTSTGKVNRRALKALIKDENV